VVIDAVPADTTVVGIPGRVVAPSRRSTHGFDLDHHLIPDPVGKAIACLLDRVAQLELTVPTQALVFATPEAPCGACDVHCTEPGFKRTDLQTATLE
jgi:serine O-acetyltransferase